MGRLLSLSLSHSLFLSHYLLCSLCSCLFLAQSFLGSSIFLSLSPGIRLHLPLVGPAAVSSAPCSLLIFILPPSHPVYLSLHLLPLFFFLIYFFSLPVPSCYLPLSYILCLSVTASLSPLSCHFIWQVYVSPLNVKCCVLQYLPPSSLTWRLSCFSVRPFSSSTPQLHIKENVLHLTQGLLCGVCRQKV